MFLHSYNKPSSTKKPPLVDTLISGTWQLDFHLFKFYNKGKSGVGLSKNFRHRSSAILFLWGYDNFLCQEVLCRFADCHNVNPSCANFQTVTSGLALPCVSCYHENCV